MNQWGRARSPPPRPEVEISRKRPCPPRTDSEGGARRTAARTSVDPGPWGFAASTAVDAMAAHARAVRNPGTVDRIAFCCFVPSV